MAPVPVSQSIHTSGALGYVDLPNGSLVSELFEGFIGSIPPELGKGLDFYARAMARHLYRRSLAEVDTTPPSS